MFLVWPCIYHGRLSKNTEKLPVIDLIVYLIIIIEMALLQKCNWCGMRDLPPASLGKKYCQLCEKHTQKECLICE